MRHGVHANARGSRASRNERNIRGGCITVTRLVGSQITRTYARISTAGGHVRDTTPVARILHTGFSGLTSAAATAAAMTARITDSKCALGATTQYYNARRDPFSLLGDRASPSTL